MGFLTPKNASQMLGISYPTIKQWIYSGKIRSVKTAGGHHRIPSTEIDRLLSEKPAHINSLGPISARNTLYGTVTEVRIEGLLAQVTVDIGGQIVTALITSDSARGLALQKGSNVYALVKATEVTIAKA